MTPDELEYGKRLFSATSDIVGRLDPKTIKGAVNWGDLDCVAAEKIESLNMLGQVETSWRVVIEEASPAAYELTTAIHNALSSEGFGDVEVQAEW